jgi:fructose-1,6-bisphosphatase/inositol monophosphatase family enzyme
VSGDSPGSTSDVARSLPWFGVLIGLLCGQVPVMAVMHLPPPGDMYAAEEGAGARKDGKPITVTREEERSKVLLAYGMEVGPSVREAERHLASATTMTQG